MISILIPSRNEKFLNPTIVSLLDNAEGEIEVIVVLDGYWTPPSDDPRVRYIHRGQPLGMRAGINAAAAIARGEFLFKIDAHCMVDQGYDVKLAADCPPNTVVIPRRKRLDADAWEIQDVGKPDVDYMYLAYADDPNDFGGPGLNGKNWDTKNADPALRSVLIDDVMSAQGSAWFMRKEYFTFLELMDEESYGTFWNEAQEIMLKAWLSGGRCIVNKKTWYAHLHKGKKHGRGYPLDERQLRRGRDHTTKWFTMGAAWHKQTLPLEWLIKKFNPPGWPEDLVQAFTTPAPDLAPPIDIPANIAPASILPPAPMDSPDDRLLDIPQVQTIRHFKRADLARKFASEGYKTGAEIGVADGRFSEVLCKSIPGLQLTCVDPWAPYPENPRYYGFSRRDGKRPNEELARERMAPFGAKMVKAMSMDAVRDVPAGSLDFVYIDGHHDFDFVMQDIIEWAKRVRRGGCVAGHDYYHFRGSGVIPAVDAYCKAHGIRILNITDEREPTWFFFKA